jgi:hypothetical protein
MEFVYKEYFIGYVNILTLEKKNCRIYKQEFLINNLLHKHL